jgi:nucleotide-binding universal stress UspA family protein
MKRILVGLDGSEQQGRILGEAVLLAQKIGAELVLFRSVALPLELPSAAFSVSPTAVSDLLVENAKKDLEAQRATVDPSVPATTRVDLGTPWRQILEAATAENVDLIVIGSHGYGGLDRLLGTTAAKVVNHSDRSVLVIRPDGPLPI